MMLLNLLHLYHLLLLYHLHILTNHLDHLHHKLQKVHLFWFKIYNIDLDHSSKVLSMQEYDAVVQEAVEIVTTAKLMTEVVTAATQVVAVSTPIPAAKPAVVDVSTPISVAKPAAKPKVLKIVVAALAISTRKRKGVVIRDPEEELHNDTPAETLSVKDKGKSKDVQAKGIQYIKRYHGFKKKPQSKSEARKNMIAYLKNTEEIEKEEEEIIRSINETPAQKAAKRRRLRKQAKEDENLKKQLEVVVDEDDDVFIKATPIGRKVPVVNYEIVMINNKPRYKIIIADDTHQLYTNFITLLKNFDREDLEDLWKIMKAKFSTSKPTNFFDDYLLVALKTMFEKTAAQDVIWRCQQTEYGQALVKSWKLLTSCGVHIITFTTTMFALLVEKNKAFRVFNSRTRIVQETLHVNFMENKPNVAGSGPAWLFDIDSLTQTMNYHPVLTENQSNPIADFQDTEKAGEEGTQTYVLFLMLSDGFPNSQNNNKDALIDGKEHDDDIQKSVSPGIHSSSSGAQTRKQGDKTDNKDKGKSPVVTITGFKDLNAEFE
nr:ribonuclease H-like domain-containing protein [Tanacetum cinerariifolium]